MKIAAVFSSYNRREVALECVGRLRAQTRPPELVVVADNASEDGSVEALRALDQDRLVVVETGDNLGNAGAVRAAMEHAFDVGCDAVWILDDDSWPRAGALEALLAGGWDGKSVRHAHQVDPKTGRFTWPLMVRDDGARGGWRAVWTEEDLPDGDFVESRISWTGALVSREVREAAGPVMGELFIRGEDEEYPLRIRQAGYRFFACRGAMMDHPGPARLASWKFFGKRLFLEPGLADWKLYYKVRNMVWMKKRHEGAAKALAMAAAYAWGLARVDGVRRGPLWWEAVRDGWRGRLGRWRGQP